MSGSYALKKFQRAVFGLAVGASPIQIRLMDAYTEHIMHLSPDDIPESERENFIKLAAQLKAISLLPRTGTPESKTGPLSDSDAMSLALQVVDMCFLIGNALDIE